mmetsp:Transcript_14176/g.30766  ORF Transcript_14176/g.30766 Transcript_14176/m.30766 type:complete len:282 (+) Transcript_14176:108-953(+)
MAPAALPLAKIGSLLIKTLSKPLAKRIKRDFARYATTQRILVGLGQSTNRLTTRMTIWAEGFKVRSIPPLEEKEAIQKGADLLGESIVFGVSVGVVVWEFNRSNEKAKAKEEKRLLEIEAENDDMEEKLHSLDLRIEALEKVVKAQSNSLYLYTGQRYVEPPKEELKPIPVPKKKKRMKQDGNSGDASADASAVDDAGLGQRSVDAGGIPSSLDATNGNEQQNDKHYFHVGADNLTSNPGRLVALEEIVGDLEKGLSSRVDEGDIDKDRPKKMGWWGWWPF